MMMPIAHLIVLGPDIVSVFVKVFVPDHGTELTSQYSVPLSHTIIFIQFDGDVTEYLTVTVLPLMVVVTDPE